MPTLLSVRKRSRLYLAFSMLLCMGCGTGFEISEYVVPTENERIVTSDVLKDEFGAIPFDWDVPDSWMLAENDQFSKVAWQVGPKSDSARITLSDLPIAAGLLPQLTRWRGQIEIELGPKDDPMDGAEPLKLEGATGTYVDFEGAEDTILGLLVPQGDKLWIFKFRSSNEIAEQQRDAFRKFCESVRIP